MIGDDDAAANTVVLAAAGGTHVGVNKAAAASTVGSHADGAALQWLTAILSPPPAKPAYSTLTSAYPSTVGMFALPAAPPAEPARAPRGRGGAEGDITACKLDAFCGAVAALRRQESGCDAALLMRVLHVALKALDPPDADAPAPAPAAPAAAPSEPQHDDLCEDVDDLDNLDDDPDADGGAAGADGGAAKGGVPTYWSKGTGFGFGDQGAVWDRERWAVERRMRARHDGAVLECVAAALGAAAGDQGGVPTAVADEAAALIAPSALPALLVELLSTDSLVDIAQQRALYEAAVGVVAAAAADERLFGALKGRDDDGAAVADALLKTTRVLAGRRVRLVDADAPTVAKYKAAARLARRHRNASGRPDEQRRDDGNRPRDHPAVDALDRPDRPPLEAPPADYCTVMGASQMGECAFTAHTYADQAMADGPPPPSCTERIVQELGALATSLPLHPGSSVFVRYDPDRLQLLKALITGPEGTPYASGCFEFDVYFPPTFPQTAPRVTLVTTGGGSVRFNPNLYNNGMVCLSILGTWPGRPEEQWGPHCTVLQVLTSIQSLVLVDEPYYNEPGYERTRGTLAGDKRSAEYTRSTRASTARVAVLGQMQSPDPAFASVVAAHFCLKRDAVLATCTRWEEEAHWANVVSTASQRQIKLEAKLALQGPAEGGSGAAAAVDAAAAATAAAAAASGSAVADKPKGMLGYLKSKTWTTKKKKAPAPAPTPASVGPRCPKCNTAYDKFSLAFKCAATCGKGGNGAVAPTATVDAGAPPTPPAGAAPPPPPPPPPPPAKPSASVGAPIVPKFVRSKTLESIEEALNALVAAGLPDFGDSVADAADDDSDSDDE